MAFFRLSTEDVLDNVFEDEESLDDSDSEDGGDIYGYLGSFAIPRNELEAESQRLCGGLLEGSDEDNNELSEPSQMEIDDDGRDEIDSSGNERLEQAESQCLHGGLLEGSDKDNNELSEPSQMEIDDDGRDEIDSSGNERLEQASPRVNGENEVTHEMVSEIMQEGIGDNVFNVSVNRFHCKASIRNN